MPNMHKPTSEEKRIIRECAQQSAGYKSVEINPSTKINEKGDIHMNIAMISDDLDFGDTDLFDNAYSWRDFTSGIEMTPDGRAIVDFYVYNRGRDPELQTNVTAYFEGNKLVRVCHTAMGDDDTIWKL